MNRNTEMEQRSTLKILHEKLEEYSTILLKATYENRSCIKYVAPQNCISQQMPIDKENIAQVEKKQKRKRKKKCKKVTPLPHSLQNSNNKTDKCNFSLKSKCTPEYILFLKNTFGSEIKSMQLRLLSEACLKTVHDDSDMIVAKVYLENKTNLAKNMLELIRSELVGWIGVYQQEGMNTPIFHSIFKYNNYIIIVCENKFAYECVQRCIEDISVMKTIENLKIVSSPPITPIVYCFDAVYKGIASDSALFLTQLNLHRPKLHSNMWVVTDHKVQPEQGKTCFIFLIDERSALALCFHYNHTFYVCMQEVTFRNCGIVRESVSN